MEIDTTWKITITGPLCEEHSQIFFESGASGVEVSSPEVLHAFVTGSHVVRDTFIGVVNSQGFRVTEFSEVPVTNWVQECEAVWRPLNFGALTITPIMSAPPPRPAAPGEIFIIPGFGFGTGHHCSTRFALELMQRHLAKGSDLGRVLDFGAGSGILSLGIATLYRGTIDAIDNDPAAIMNGNENIALNAQVQRISVKCGSTELIQGPYNLIVVNLYAELISSFESSFYDHLVPGSFCIMAGITTESEHILTDAYKPNRWSIVERLEENGWIGVVYRKNPSS